MALPIIRNWQTYFDNPHEGLGSSYERIVLNKLLLSIKQRYNIKNVLEAPVFGFTGLTGLNSLALYKAGCGLTLLDHDEVRLQKIRTLMDDLSADVNIRNTSSYKQLDFPDASFDLSWNFSALWFVEDLDSFLNELVRVTTKAILICVPNQTGLGYKWQKANSEVPPGLVFHEEYIDPELITGKLRKLKWKLMNWNYIDCPPWPDIGMSKEKFLGRYLKNLKLKSESGTEKKQISIIDYYKGQDPGFPDRMLKFDFLERYAPVIFKKYWCHHKWMLFEPGL